MADDRLYRLLAKVFGVPLSQITEDATPDTIEKWDSLSQINMILAIESEYGISLGPEEAMEMRSIKMIRMTLADHGIDA
jgi:acyl carrier protein